MKNPKKQDDAKVRRGEASDDLGDLFKDIDSLGPSLGNEDEEVLELDEVVDEDENSLKDLPDLEDGLSDLDDLDSALDEPAGEKSPFDEEEVTVELGPSGGGAELPHEPLDEELFDEKPHEPEEALEREPEPLPAEAQEGAMEFKNDGGLLAPMEKEALRDETEKVEEPESLETEEWDADAELDALPKDTMPKEERLEVFEDVKAGVASVAPKEERVDGKVEKVMEEGPALFQPIVEILEHRLRIMVQKAVQEQLPIVVRRVLQEEIERLSKILC